MGPRTHSAHIFEIECIRPIGWSHQRKGRQDITREVSSYFVQRFYVYAARILGQLQKVYT